MMAPPKTFAPAAVSPSSKLVRMGDMKKENSRLRLVYRRDAGCRVSSPGPETGEPQSLLEERTTSVTPQLLGFWRRTNSERREFHAALDTTHRMAGLRTVFDHPRLLAYDSSVC